ncbi:hypothetical protein QYE76_059321 [Lolium multiflorum]|uniref:AtPDCT1/2 transmembrane domain-containing protein n=1 Tax=Lolium multiflorum TaxID=4521 RepID=A0AAD8QIV1_LOLMU|nr:hypothetical protein QYE76_059321 [Lolium multiflorum]
MPPPSLPAAQDQAASAVRRAGKGKKVHPLPVPDGAAMGEEKPAATTRRPAADWLTPAGVAGILARHPLPALFACGLLLFMAVEYTIPMIPPAAPPLDLGFVATAAMHAAIDARPWLNSLLAALNTVFVAMQAAYILWAILVEQRPRAAIATLMMFTCRGLLGCSTQLPLPAEFLGSPMDFPVGNVSFFLFYSGHVAGAVIASLDMRRVGRYRLAGLYDALNLAQVVRLLACRGHYTIDLAVGVGAGLLFDMLAAKYLESKNIETRCCSNCQKALVSQKLTS